MDNEILLNLELDTVFNDVENLSPKVFGHHE
jgi:hypothetical protein